MRNLLARYITCIFFICFIFTSKVFAQSLPGKIIREASASATLHAAYFTPTTVTSKAILDPNNDGFVSSGTSGFPVSDDVTQSEINYKPIVPYSIEPYGDLRRGPSHMYSDFVPGIDNASYYMFFRSTAGSEALLFRMRMGTIIPGAKAYSVLLDTDGKFGASGANADPNYKAATTGSGGNPGFEIEIVLTTQIGTQTGIAIYNVDGTDSPGAPVWSALEWKNYSQIALASTSDNGDPDFFLDFFIPFSRLASLGVTASTPLRAVATTVMSPQGAIGGPKSDIYGLADDGFKDPNSQYELFMAAQPSFTPTVLGGTGTASPTAIMCTAAPAITAVTLGAASNGNVKGTWTKTNLSTASSSANITIYRTVAGITTILGTVPTTSGATGGWTLSNVTINKGDIITAKAQGSGTGVNESMCQTSNSITATNCTSANIPPAPVLGCSSGSKGTSGSNFQAGWTVHIQNISRGTAVESASATGTTGLFSITGSTWTYSNGCSGGSSMASGSYKIWYTNADGCASDPAYYCSNGGTASTLNGATAPTITTPSGAAFTNATTGIAGNATAGSVVYLYINRILAGTANADAATGAYAFPNSLSTNSLRLSVNDNLYLISELNNGTAGAINTSKCAVNTATYTVVCFVASPVIITEANGQLATGKPITGTSTEAAGTAIRVYNAANALLATTTVQTNGTWSTATAGTVYGNGFSGNAAAGTTYYANSTAGTCTSANSVNAATGLAAPSVSRCGSITTSVPATSPLKITTATTSLSGSLGTAVANTTVNLYEDGFLIGSITTSGTTWGAVDVSNKLYASTNALNGTIYIGIQEAGTAEVTCPNTYKVNADCVTPAAPTVSPGGSQSVSPGQTITYTIQSPTAGLFYTISDESTGKELASGVWSATTSDFSMTTKPVTSNTVAVIKAVSMTNTGEVCISNTASRSVTILPLSLLEFSGKATNGATMLNWRTAQEINTKYFEVERSEDGISYSKIGFVYAVGNGANTYGFTDHQALAVNNYYRLKIIDKDDRFTYSKIIVINGDGNSLVVNSISPNPFQNFVHASLILPKAQKLVVELTNSNGHMVKQLTITGQKGYNNVALHDLRGLPAGIYMLIIKTNEKVLQQKIMKASY